MTTSAANSPTAPVPAPPAATAPDGSPDGRGGRRALVIGAVIAAVAILGTVGAIALFGGNDTLLSSPSGTSGTTTGATTTTGTSGSTSATGASGQSGSTVPNGCNGGTAPTILPDGTYFGYIRSLDLSSGAIAFDLACFYTGKEANEQAAQRGDEVPVPNDVYIVNENPTIRNLTVDPSVKLKLIDWNRCCDPTKGANLEAFASSLGNQEMVELDGRSYAGSLSPYWVTIENGEVVKIEEQFLP